VNLLFCVDNISSNLFCFKSYLKTNIDTPKRNRDVHYLGIAPSLWYACCTKCFGNWSCFCCLVCVWLIHGSLRCVLANHSFKRSVRWSRQAEGERKGLARNWKGFVVGTEASLYTFRALTRINPKDSDDGLQTQNHWLSALCPSSGIINTRKHNVSETGCFRPQTKGGRHLLCWVRWTGPWTMDEVEEPSN
jgi:hypothetical protein